MLKSIGTTAVLLLFMLGSLVSAQSAPLRVVATTTIIADVARNVGGDLVEVTALIPPDSDVHAFQLTPRDARTLAEAQVILVNGAGLESFLGDLPQEVANVPLTVISNGIEVLAFGGHNHDEEAHEEAHAEDEHSAEATAEAHTDEEHSAEATAEAHADEEHTDEHADEHAAEAEHKHDGAEYVGTLGTTAECGEHDHAEETYADEEAHGDEEHAHGECDPHFWTDPLNVMIWAQNIAEVFAQVDPANAATYQANASAYQETLRALDEEVRQILSSVPEEKRVIVTNHEFLGYFATHYDFEIAGVILSGGTTLVDPSPQELASLVETMRQEGVTAIFAEVSNANRLAELLAQEVGDAQVLTLYTDALSSETGPASTYVDYLRFNAQTIAQALSQ